MQPFFTVYMHVCDGESSVCGCHKTVWAHSVVISACEWMYGCTWMEGTHTIHRRWEEWLIQSAVQWRGVCSDKEWGRRWVFFSKSEQNSQRERLKKHKNKQLEWDHGKAVQSYGNHSNVPSEALLSPSRAWSSLMNLQKLFQENYVKIWD